MASDNPNMAAGSINDTATTQPSTFSEIGIDLTASGLVEPGLRDAQERLAHSRPSSSFSAELKDFIFGAVSISTCPTGRVWSRGSPRQRGQCELLGRGGRPRLVVVVGRP